MKCQEIIDATIEEAEYPLVELPNGQRLQTNDHRHCHDKGGNRVLVILAGRKLK